MTLARVPLLDRQGLVRARALIDLDDAPLVKDHRWSLSNGYAITRLPGQAFWPMHRAILGLAPGDPGSVDHINHDRLDNRRCNLRLVTPAQNSQNLPAHRGKRGVHWDATRGRWIAVVFFEGVSRFLGRFETEDEAAQVASDWRAEHMPFAVEENTVPSPDLRGVVDLEPAPSRRRWPRSSKLSEAEATAIRERRAAGERGRALAAEFGVSEQLVCDIAKGRRWPVAQTEGRAMDAIGSESEAR